MKADIRTYEEPHWPALSAFLREHWSAQHPVLRKPLFDWQYRGFADAGSAPQSASLLMFDRESVVAFLGLIPGLYQVNTPRADVIFGAALAMWIVHPDYRGAGLGLLLLAEAERRHPLLCCLGANREASGYYRSRGYQSCAHMQRFVAPLSVHGYRQLLACPISDTALAELGAWSDAVLSSEPLAPQKVDSSALARLWLRSTQGADGWAVQGLHRSTDFWSWRYAHSTGFQYLSFGEPSRAGVIGRIEPVQGHDAGVFRVIEALSSDASSRQGQTDDRLCHAVRGALAWARTQGCVAADFQCCGDALSATMDSAGMRLQGTPLDRHPLTSLCPVFQPLMADKPPINVFWKYSAETNTPWYFAKSDGDMDRPHV